MTTYKMSNGDRVEKSVIDHRVRDAKIEKLKIQVLEEDYVYCKEIGCKAPNKPPFDCSHDISVKKCQETGRSELAWDLSNITIRCRRCHNIHDKTY